MMLVFHTNNLFLFQTYFLIVKLTKNIFKEFTPQFITSMVCVHPFVD